MRQLIQRLQVHAWLQFVVSSRDNSEGFEFEERGWRYHSLPMGSTRKCLKAHIADLLFRPLAESTNPHSTSIGAMRTF